MRHCCRKTSLNFICVNTRLLDSVSVDKILHFEQDLFDYFDGKHADLLETIRTTKDLPDTDALDAAITEFSEMFAAANNSGDSARSFRKIDNA